MRHLLLPTALLALSCLSAPVALADDAPQQPVTWQFDTAHSHIAFQVSHLGYSTTFGEFEAFDGQLVLDEAAPQDSQVTVTIDASSIDTGHAARDEHLQGDKWLNTDEFPTMRFVSTGIELSGDNTASVSGNLTLLGETRPVTLDVSLNGRGTSPFSGLDVIGFEATTRILRSEFGMTHAIPAIEDQITILISAELNPAP
ncbi:MAG: YceI family protein [Alphaproteobacteria bacterium]